MDTDTTADERARLVEEWMTDEERFSLLVSVMGRSAAGTYNVAVGRYGPGADRRRPPGGAAFWKLNRAG